VVAVGKHAAAALPELVQRHRHAGQQALHGAGQRDAVFGLGQQVQVVVEDREVGQPEAFAAAAGALFGGGECLQAAACVRAAGAASASCCAA
jgi:hypothetical protein